MSSSLASQQRSLDLVAFTESASNVAIVLATHVHNVHVGGMMYGPKCSAPD